MRNRRKLIGGIGAAVALVLLVIALWPRPQQTLSYVTSPASRGDISQQLTLVGPVERSGASTVEFSASGLVTAVHTKVGDTVTAGQQIASIDPAELRLALLQARAQLTQAQAQLDSDLASQKAGSSRTQASTGGAGGLGGAAGGLPSGAAGAAGGLPAGASGGGAGAAAGGAPGGGAGSQQGLGGLAGGTPPYLTAMNESLGAVQQAVVTQQKQCTPVFEALQQFKDIQLPTAVPTALPSTLPSNLPTALPSGLPSTLPTGLPTVAPQGRSAAGSATATPSAAPSGTATPSGTPTPSGTATPSGTPTPTASPSPTPSRTPSATPMATPTSRPTATPSATASQTPPITQADLDKLVGMADQVTACSNAMAAVATAEVRAGAAITAAVQGFAQQTQQATAALAAAQANVEAAARQASEEAMKAAQEEMAKQLAANFGGTVTDATIASDRAAVLQAQQGVDQAETNLNETTITAPVSGVVGALDFVVGESSGGKSATVVGPGAVSITVDVPLADRPLVGPGVTAQVGHLASQPTLTGNVTTVGVLPTSTSGAPSYPAKLSTDDASQTLPQGSYAQVTLDLARARDVLVVPMSAVTKTSEHAGTVQVVSEKYATSAETVAVTTGRQGDGRIEITSGLTEGQLVVLADRRLPVPGGLSDFQGGGPQEGSGSHGSGSSGSGNSAGTGEQATPTPTASR